MEGRLSRRRELLRPAAGLSPRDDSRPPSLRRRRRRRLCRRRPLLLLPERNHSSNIRGRGECLSNNASSPPSSEQKAAQESIQEEEEEGEEDIWSKRNHLRVTKGFLPQELATELRGTYDERFADPREGSSERFVWDYWHVPEQYSLLRTPVSSERNANTHTHTHTQRESFFQLLLLCISFVVSFSSFSSCFTHDITMVFVRQKSSIGGLS